MVSFQLLFLESSRGRWGSRGLGGQDSQTEAEVGVADAGDVFATAIHRGAVGWVWLAG